MKHKRNKVSLIKTYLEVIFYDNLYINFWVIFLIIIFYFINKYSLDMVFFNFIKLESIISEDSLTQVLPQIIAISNSIFISINLINGYSKYIEKKGNFQKKELYYDFLMAFCSRLIGLFHINSLYFDLDDNIRELYKDVGISREVLSKKTSANSKENIIFFIENFEKNMNLYKYVCFYIKDVEVNLEKLKGYAISFSKAEKDLYNILPLLINNDLMTDEFFCINKIIYYYNLLNVSLEIYSQSISITSKYYLICQQIDFLESLIKLKELIKQE